MTEPLELSYRTAVEERRPGLLGDALTWLGQHPILGGLICGLIAIAIAALRVPEGVLAQPAVAAGISAVVLAAWAGLFFLMRSFFYGQSFVQRPVLRKLTLSDDHARWTQDGDPLKEIPTPTLRLLTSPLPDEDSTAKLWPVFLVIGADDHDDPIILETRDTLDRARTLDEAPKGIRDNPDERLPRPAALPFLQRWQESASTQQ